MGRQSVQCAPRPQAQASTICNVTAPVSLSVVLLPQVAAIAHLLAGLCPTSHSRRCGVGAQRPKAAYGHPQKVMRPSRCCREAEGAGQKGDAGVDTGRVAAAYLVTFHDHEGVLFIGKAQEKSTVFHAEKRHGPETKRRWSAWNCLTWRCANSGSIASAHCGGRAKNIRCKDCLREDTVGADRVAMAATGDQADDVLAAAYGGAAT